MNKIEASKKLNQNKFSFISNNYTQKQNKILKNIDDDSLYNISYSSPKKQNINSKIIKNYIDKKQKNINIFNSGHKEEDQR